MDLASFAQMPAEGGNKSYLKFKQGDNIKIVRFLYDNPTQIECRKKKYENGKVIWDSEDGKWTMNLRVAVYSSKTEYEIMTWDRSANFGRDNLLPIFEAAGGKVSDHVYKITCTKPGTLDATFTLFPLPDSDTYAVPDMTPEAQPTTATATAQPATQPVAQQPVAQAVEPTPAPMPQQPVKKKQFWEE